ncbi:HalOD1 output domain-containing protein [Haloarculaceae archaeon H-GB11]|nr:HalOD1 output domain-containing protein [Haloarculaceae archaeon H-GB11]
MVKSLAMDDEMRAVAEFEFTDRNGESIILGIVDALATVRGVEPTELEPLQNYVNTDALVKLVASQLRNGPDAGDLKVTFEYDAYEVTVESYGRIHVTGPTNHDESR